MKTNRIIEIDPLSLARDVAQLYALNEAQDEINDALSGLCQGLVQQIEKQNEMILKLAIAMDEMEKRLAELGGAL